MRSLGGWIPTNGLASSIANALRAAVARRSDDERHARTAPTAPARQGAIADMKDWAPNHPGHAPVVVLDGRLPDGVRSAGHHRDRNHLAERLQHRAEGAHVRRRLQPREKRWGSSGCRRGGSPRRWYTEHRAQRDRLGSTLRTGVEHHGSTRLHTSEENLRTNRTTRLVTFEGNDPLRPSKDC
jgi:hypothetical protein